MFRSKTKHYLHSESPMANAIHGVWMILVVMALLISVTPASQWVACLTRAVETSHEVQMVRNGCDVFVVLKHQINPKPWEFISQNQPVHEHTAGDNLLSLFGRTLDTQQDHIIQLPCEGSSGSLVSSLRFQQTEAPTHLVWSHIQDCYSVPVLIEAHPTPFSITGSVFKASRFDSGMLTHSDRIASRQSTILLI